MQQLAPSSQKRNGFRHKKKYSWILLSLVVMVCVQWPHRLIAIDVPPEPNLISANWQHASFPVENFIAYTSPFGYRQSPTDPSKQQFHRGLDLAAPLGSYIRNWWTGTVVELSDNTACGTLIKIKSGDWLHIYCHLHGHVEVTSKGRYLSDTEGGIQLWLGQEVASGTRIGRVGMTGRTTGPHLHWGLKYRGEYVDPALVLKEMKK